MMTRISSHMANLASLNHLLRNQSELVTAQNQVSSGLKASDLKGQADSVAQINSLRAVLARSQGALDRISQVQPKLNIQAQSLGQVSAGGDSLKQTLLDTLSTNDGGTLMDQVQGAFDSVKNALNTKYDGQYLFAGVRTGVTPFSANSMADLTATTDVSTLFHNDNLKPVSRIDDGQPVETGFLATDVGKDLMNVFRNIKAYNDGPNGPFGTSLTPAQQDFLQSQIAALEPVQDNARQEEAKNGLLQNQVDDAQTRENDRQTSLKSILGDMEDVDMAKAATRLQQAQTAVEVSAKAFTVLSSTSLLTYLR